MQNYEMHGKKLEIAQHLSKDKRDRTEAKFNNLYVKNLLPGTSEEELNKMFSEFGLIESVHIAKDEGDQAKDYGFVCFKNPDDASKAMESMNKKQLGEDKFLIVN
jgi:polyadenylate-binding protein